MGENDTVPKRRFPWLKAALVVSVMLNLAGFAMFGAIATRAGEPGAVLRSAVAALPGEARREMRREMREIWRDARLRAGAQSTQREMIASLRADEFDAARFSDSLTQAQTRLLQISTDMHARLVAQVSAMSPEARQAYADALEEVLSQRRRGDRGSGGRSPEPASASR